MNIETTRRMAVGLLLALAGCGAGQLSQQESTGSDSANLLRPTPKPECESSEDCGPPRTCIECWDGSCATYAVACFEQHCVISAPTCPPRPQCRDSDCPQPDGPCLVCRDGSTVCPSGGCRDGACVVHAAVCPDPTRCDGDDDCRLFSNYCAGCACEALAKGEPDPLLCVSAPVQCFQDPCASRRAVCDPSTRQCIVARAAQ